MTPSDALARERALTESFEATAREECPSCGVLISQPVEAVTSFGHLVARYCSEECRGEASCTAYGCGYDASGERR